MRDLILTPRARRDMGAIWLYTAERWGIEQADVYIRGMEAAITSAREHPRMGSSVFGLPDAYRKMRSGRHRVIYRATETALVVVRIIHAREDVPDDIEDFW